METNDATRANEKALPSDPLIAAIEAYDFGMAAYEGSEEFETPEAEDAAIAATYGPPNEVLMNWSEPATTRAGAIAALRMAARGQQIIGLDIQQNMTKAALAYFEQEGDVTVGDTNMLDGGAGRTDPVYAVSNLVSLFSVCALAIEGADVYRKDIRDRALEDIKLTMVLSSHLAKDAALAVERAISAAGKGGVS